MSSPECVEESSPISLLQMATFMCGPAHRHWGSVPTTPKMRTFPSQVPALSVLQPAANAQGLLHVHWAVSSAAMGQHSHQKGFGFLERWFGTDVPWSYEKLSEIFFKSISVTAFQTKSFYENKKWPDWSHPRSVFQVTNRFLQSSRHKHI